MSETREQAPSLAEALDRACDIIVQNTAGFNESVVEFRAALAADASRREAAAELIAAAEQYLADPEPFNLREVRIAAARCREVG